MPEIVQWIGYIITLLSFFGVLTAFLKKLKKIAEGQQCQLRSDITAIYYKHCDESAPTLREFERKNLDSLVEAYKALDGNNYVDDLYEIMRRWKVKK
jgi:hypothetical protein